MLNVSSCLLLAATGLLQPVPPIVTNVAQIVDGRLHGTPIRVVGTIHDVFCDAANDHYNFIAVNCGGSPLYGGLLCTNQAEALRDLQRLIGCRVEIPCICQRRNQTYARRMLGHELTNFTVGDIRILKAPDRKAFDVPPLERDFSVLNAILTSSPRKIRGVVVARWNKDSMLVRTEDGDPVVATLGIPTLPELNAHVEVIGLPETDLYNCSLVQARWRPISPNTTRSPNAPRQRNATIRDILGRGGNFMINPEFHGRTTRLHGRVKNLTRGKDGSLRITLSDGDLILKVDCSATPDAFARLREGCGVEVTGIFVLTCDAWRSGAPFPKIRELLLVTRNESDLTILSQPPWWTPFRFLLAVIVFCALLLAILIWNAVLRATVARKSRELLREQAAKLGETLKIDERTRLAAELHDNLAQNLTVVSYRIAAARSAFTAKSPATEDLLSGAERMLQSCRTDLRNCLWDLRSDVLNEHDFAEAIRQTIRPLVENIAVRVRFDISRAATSDMTTHTILCIVRELVFNAVTHGKTTNIRIAGARENGIIRFSVCDNGIGFVPEQRPASREGHFGLDGVRERLRRYDGDLRIESSPGNGTRAVVTLYTRESKR